MAYFFLHQQRIAEPFPGSLLTAAVMLGSQGDVRLELVAKLLGRGSPPEPSDQAHPSTLRTPSVKANQLRSACLRRRRPALLKR